MKPWALNTITNMEEYQMYKTLIEKTRQELVDVISEHYYSNNMAFAFYRLIDTCLYEYCFDESIIAELFFVAQQRRIIYKHTAMENMARDWFLAGIKNTTEARALEDRRIKLEKLQCAKTCCRKECDKLCMYKNI